MDAFFKEEYIDIFKSWIYFKVKKYNLKINDNIYYLNYNNKQATITIWNKKYIEEEILENNNSIFYIHYEFINFKYSTDLIERMLDKLEEKTILKNRKILLCCSSGLTTGYFASRLNDYCKLNHIPYTIDAIGLQRLEEVKKDYSLVLFAPQVQYYLNKEKLDIKYNLIDPGIFATYDCQRLIKIISSNIKEA